MKMSKRVADLAAEMAVHGVDAVVAALVDGKLALQKGRKIYTSTEVIEAAEAVEGAAPSEGSIVGQIAELFDGATAGEMEELRSGLDAALPRAA